MSSNGFEITHSSVCKLTQNDIILFSSKEYWHKFIIEKGGTFEKDTVLHAVLDSISPFDLVPVKYTVTGEDAYFLARNCGSAIEKFCLNLLLPIEVKNGQVNLKILICHIPIDEYKMNMQLHLKNAIEKRCDKTKKGFVDLTCFHKEPELYQILFCPLSRPRFLLYVLSILKRIPKIESIKLSNNDIENLKAFEVLKEFKHLVCLDLSNNKIEDMNCAELIGKAVPALKKINLSRNSVCENFKNELEYVKWIKKEMPNVKIIDGFFLNYGVPNQKVYICDKKAQTIVNEFLRYYFILYDKQRETLENAYDKNAIFTLTCSCSPSKNFKDSNLECYNNRSRNLLNDKSNMKKNYLTNTSIAELLCKLPITEHDPFSFKVDVPYFKDGMLIIIVSGVFKDFQEGSKAIHSFNRTFVLKNIGINEYKITNDLYHVTRTNNDEIRNSFLYKKEIPKEYKPKLLVNKEEEKSMIEKVCEITSMNPAYSKRCLEDCNWDLKKALQIFLENYEGSKIPPEAFNQSVKSS